MKSIKYFIKFFGSLLFYRLGGLYLLKALLKKEPYLLVLNYHNFSKYNNFSIKRGSILETGYAVNFEKQVRFLKKHFTFLFPEEFFEAEPEKGINVLISFDDGYKDNYDIAYPILKKQQAKTIFFVVTSLIGTNEWLRHDKLRLLVAHNLLLENEVESALRKMNKGIALPDEIIVQSKQYEQYSGSRTLMMNWSELKEIQAQGFKIMPHTANHAILSFLNKEEQEQEIMGSINRIDSELHQNSDYFAYPNGLYDSRTIEVLKSSDIKYGFTTIPGTNTKKEKRLELKRIGINASDSVSLLLLKLFMAAIK
ncbi:polysaccharide deacetylase family protein [Arenibacter sp. TNZ]|jgi:peptidoglycan/xylan/chitin deacetylase (PgdA/CDA1 family)|uniref:polysaccharide deacetylase family protein n=1 Tax=Arenibacter TaxID=178469 RepID=UPI000CD45851|nr:MULTISPECIES: polysaccharide deacetylase family protein [Arenibacter]MCM4174098.1 polysaccharide deacetylase family protein [Arenibacter sp. TNZ]